MILILIFLASSLVIFQFQFDIDFICQRTHEDSSKWNSPTNVFATHSGVNQKVS